MAEHESIIAIKRWATAARALEALPENAYLDPDKMDQLIACLCEMADAKAGLFKAADEQLKITAKKVIKESDLSIVYKHNKPYGIRDGGGYLLFFPAINKYDGQEERYRDEIETQYGLADFILSALQSVETSDEKVRKNREA